MTLSTWFKLYKNGSLKKDYDSKYGVQCVDMANSYAEHCLKAGSGVFYGVRYAKDIFKNYNKNKFYRVKNEGLNYPPKGALIIWNRGTAGHIAVVTSATEHTINVVEANYNGKGGIREHTYTNYNNVLGWLVPYKIVNTPSIDLYVAGKTLISEKIITYFKKGKIVNISGFYEAKNLYQVQYQDKECYITNKYIK